jgi:hypothetical protein
MLIDWLTLRLRLDAMPDELSSRLNDNMSHLTLTDADGVLIWQKASLDLDRLRTDSHGLFWQIQGDGDGRRYLAIGGSPASIAHDGVNVFGTSDIRKAATVLIGAARRALGALVPGYRSWQCRRIDVTENYVLPDEAAVDVALSQLMVSDTARRKASTRTGNTVYWSPSSDRRKGKAYSKGRHLRFMVRKKGLDISPVLLAASSRLLRLELSLCARWCRELEAGRVEWWKLDQAALSKEHSEFFGALNLSCEVAEMGTSEAVASIARASGISEARARAAFYMYTLIRAQGVEAARAVTSRATWFRNMSYLRAAGFTDAHIRSVNVLPFPRVRLDIARCVQSWAELLAA